jgi:hypothetical protein
VNVNVNVKLRNGAQDETNGEASSASHPQDVWSNPAVTTTDPDEHDNDHNSSFPQSSTPLHSQYTDDDKISGATLGDIMSDGGGLQMTSHSSSGTRKSTGIDSTSSSSSSTLARQYGIKHPLDRMALTANGNLQRLVSSYYDAPVSVVVDSCMLRKATTNGATSTDSTTSLLPSTTPKVWDRTVHLTVFGGQTFCTAVSVITVHDPLCQQLVQSGQVGLGQLFRYLDLLPEFTLSGAGTSVGAGVENNEHDETLEASSTRTGKGSGGGGGGGGFWRDYTLSCAELTCDIHEEFRPGLWDMQPRDNNGVQNGVDSSASARSA